MIFLFLFENDLEVASLYSSGGWYSFGGTLFLMRRYYSLFIFGKIDKFFFSPFLKVDFGVRKFLGRGTSFMEAFFVRDLFLRK